VRGHAASCAAFSISCELNSGPVGDERVRDP